MLLTKLIEIKDALELREAPALLEPALFQDTNKISLPVQVNPLEHEDNAKHAIWYALEEFGVYGEVNLGKGYGRIDLLCEHSDVRVGIECKKLLKEGIAKQLCKYRDSGCLNALYLAPLAIGNYEFLLDYIVANVKGGLTELRKNRLYYWGKIAAEQFNPNLKYGEHKRTGRGGLPPVARGIQERTKESDPEIQEGKENLLKKLMVKG